MKAKKNHSLAFIGGGIGSIAGQTHFNASQMDSRFKVIGGSFSQHQQTNIETATMWDIPCVYDEWTTMLDDLDNSIDACVILTPTPTHASIITELLKRNIPIICEKAFVSSASEVEEIYNYYKPEKHFLCVTFNYTGYPLIRELRERILNNELGDIINIRIKMPQESFLRPPVSQKYPQAWRLHDGEIPTICLDLGVHIHHMASFLTQMEPISVLADMRTFSHYRVIDDVEIMVRYPNGASGHFWMSKTALGNRNGLEVEIYGTKGAARWIQVTPEQLFIQFSNGEKKIVERGGETMLCGQKRYNRMTPGHPAGFIEAFANLYVDMADALDQFKNKTGKASPYVFGIDEASQGLSFFEKATQSFHNKQWVELIK